MSYVDEPHVSAASREGGVFGSMHTGMRSHLLALCTATVLLLSLGHPGAAQAKDLNGRFAIGGQQNSLGQRGLSVKYWVGHLGFNILFGGNSVSSKVTGSFEDDGETKEFEGDDTQRNIDSALRVLFNAARAKDVNMYVGGGIGVGSLSGSVLGAGATPVIAKIDATEVGFELFVGAEYFLSNHFAVQAEVGVPMRFVSEDGPAIAGGGDLPEGSYMHFFRPATWAAGFSFYF